LKESHLKEVLVLKNLPIFRYVFHLQEKLTTSNCYTSKNIIRSIKGKILFGNVKATSAKDSTVYNPFFSHLTISTSIKISACQNKRLCMVSPIG